MAGEHRGLLVDFGGVLTTDVFASFQAFCEIEGLEPTLVRDRFMSDETAPQLLFDLEIGALTEEEFEPRFAAVLEVERHDGLIDRLFAGIQPDELMVAAVRNAKSAGVRTGLISNSWGKGRYDRSQFPVLFDGVVISGEVGLRKPDPAHLRARGRGDRPAARGVRLRRRPAGQPQAGARAGDGDRPPPHCRGERRRARGSARDRPALARRNQRDADQRRGDPDLLYPAHALREHQAGEHDRRHGVQRAAHRDHAEDPLVEATP